MQQHNSENSALITLTKAMDPVNASAWRKWKAVDFRGSRIEKLKKKASMFVTLVLTQLQKRHW